MGGTSLRCWFLGYANLPALGVKVFSLGQSASSSAYDYRWRRPAIFARGFENPNLVIAVLRRN